MYPSEWKGSKEDVARAGEARFMVDGVAYSFHLPDFGEYLHMCKALESAFNHGKAFAASNLVSAIDGDFKRRARELGAEC